LIGDRRQAANRYFDGAGEVRRIHSVGDIQRAEIAGDVLANGGVIEIFVKGGGAIDLQESPI
jgi:hypothetical protein